MKAPNVFTIIADDTMVGKRLDTTVADHISECTRSLAVSLIAKGCSFTFEAE